MSSAISTGAGRLKASRAILYALVVWAPFPLGSNRPLFWAINGAASCLAFALMLSGEAVQNRRPDFDWRPAAWLAAGVATLSAWMVVQAMPWLPALLHHPIWMAVSRDAAGTISIDPGATWTTIAEVVPTALLAFVAMRTAVDRRRARFLLRLIFATAVAVGAYGLIAEFIGLQQVFLLDSPPYQGFLTGPFVGRSSAALYFVIGIVAALSLAVGEAEQRLSRRQGFFLVAVDVLGQSGFLVVGGMVLIVALLDTGSRGGLIVGSVAILAVAWFSLARAASRRQRLIGLATATGLVALLLLFAISGNLLLGRLYWDVGGGGRTMLYTDVLHMIWERPLLGHGAGAFISAFPLYHALADPGVVWNRAHDTYLQTIAELGLPMFLVVAAMVVGAFLAIVRSLRQRLSSAPVCVAAAGATVAAAVHAIIDFSPQIESVGLTLTVLLGAGLGEALRLRNERSAEEDKPAAETAHGRFRTIRMAVKKRAKVAASAH